MRDDTGDKLITRRAYNERFGQPTPEVEVPDEGMYLWLWFLDITLRVHRSHDGGCHPIPPSEWLAWTKLTGHVIYPWEYDILAAVDLAFCSETNKELEGQRAADAERAKSDAKRGGKGR